MRRRDKFPGFRRTPSGNGDGHDQFMRNTRHLIEQLTLRLSAVQAERATAQQQCQELERRCTSLVSGIATQALPDLAPRTIAQLKVTYPEFVRLKTTQEAIAASDIEVPFWTWFWGKSAQYKAAESARQLQLLRAHFQQWINADSARSGNTQALSQLQQEHAAAQQKVAQLATKESTLKRQIAGLERAARIYSQDNAPEPPDDLREAVSHSTRTLRRSYGDARYSDTSSSNDTFLRDILIADAILDSVREPRRRYVDHDHNDHFHTGQYNPREGELRPGGGDFGGAGHSASYRDDRGAGAEIDVSSDRNQNDRGAGVEISMATDHDRNDRGAGVEINLGGDSGRGMAMASAGHSRGDLS
jgi:hypothetical protein